MTLRKPKRMPVGVRWVSGMGCPPYMVTDRGLTDAEIAELEKQGPRISLAQFFHHHEGASHVQH